MPISVVAGLGPLVIAEGLGGWSKQSVSIKCKSGRQADV